MQIGPERWPCGVVHSKFIKYLNAQDFMLIANLKR